MSQKNIFSKISILLVFLMPVLLQAQVDLELSMSSNNPQVGIYEYITITANLQNTGNQSADNVIVNFDIPAEVAIAGEFAPVAEQGTYDGFYGGSTLGTWTVGNIDAGQSLSFEVTLFTLSADNISFYGQVFQGGNNDVDSTPGNGTCCTANEDDEAAYTFPNDGPGCTFDQAFAELICVDNGTPNDASDDTYTLSFRVDGSNGEFFLFIPELNYSQTSAYSIGTTGLTQLSLDITSLELIFSDEAATEGCGQTLIVTAPSCGEVTPNCEITYNEISNTIDDMGTPGDLFDDTFTIVYTIENTGGGTGFVGQFGGQFCGQVPSTGNYGEEITFTANVANWGNGTPVGCQIVDNQDSNCTGGYTLLPAVDCGFGNVCSDLELTAANTPTPGIYDNANASFTLGNDFLGEDATGIQVTFNKNALNVVGSPTVSQGTIDLFWTDNPVWNVGSLASNQTATIDFDLFTLSEDYSLYGEVTTQNENDFDSSPNNGNGVSPVEDDEAIYSSGDVTPTCNLTISETELTCAGNGANSAFVYSIEVSGASGNTVDYQVLGTNFSGTIITGQLVDVATLPQGLDFTIVVTDPNIIGCDYTLTSNIPVAPGACNSGECSVEVTELVRACIDPGNPSSNISITATAVSSTGNSMNVTINGLNVGTVESGISTQIFTTGQGAILESIVFTDSSNSTCSATTSSFQSVFPNECGDVTCNIFDPQISNVSCTETSLTFDVFVSGSNISNNLELQSGSTEIAITPDAVTTVTIPRTGTSTEIVIIDLDFSGTQFQDFCLTQAFVECTPDPIEGADVMLSVSNGPNTPDGIYQGGEAIFTITNTGTSPASGLTVTFAKNEVNITGTPTTTAGTPQVHWTANPLWQVGTLAPGQSEIIVFPVFTVGENFTLYGELTAMNEADSDSTPNNGNGSTPVEDDEALWPSSGNSIELPDLVLTNVDLTINSTEIGGTIDYSFTIENQGDAPNMSDFVYTGFVTEDASITTPYSVQGIELVTDIINPGQSITRSGTFTINANVPDGYNYFGIIVDGGGNITESNESNNAYLDGLFFFDEANNPCMIDLELINIDCSEAEGVYDLTIAMEAVNLFPINQTYTTLNGEFLGVAFSGASDVRTFFDIPLDQVTTISTSDSASSGCGTSLVIEVDPETDCDVVPQGVDLELSVSASTANTLIFETYSVTYTLTNTGSEEATGVVMKSPRNSSVVYEGGNEYTASQGDLDIGASNSFWDVGSLAAGETATLTMNFFTLETGSITNWAYVISQNEPDFDSTPNEWTCCVPVEDDEAGVIVSVTQNQNFISQGAAALSSSSVLSVNAYPVPAQDYLTVEISSISQNAASIEVLDVNGRAQIVSETEAVKGLQTIEIPVSDLEKGIYLLSVRKGEETVVQRFVKM